MSASLIAYSLASCGSIIVFDCKYWLQFAVDCCCCCCCLPSAAVVVPFLLSVCDLIIVLMLPDFSAIDRGIYRHYLVTLQAASSLGRYVSDKGDPANRDSEGVKANTGASIRSASVLNFEHQIISSRQPAFRHYYSYTRYMILVLVMIPKLVLVSVVYPCNIDYTRLLYHGRLPVTI